ncbi:hypothetical protein N181_14650 [Sinorhizobium fredii USDA 205]|nr:hypothetical protein N181_14650 [Sinorhizobium fredii USDA 205]
MDASAKAPDSAENSVGPRVFRPGFPRHGDFRRIGLQFPFGLF